MTNFVKKLSLVFAAGCLGGLLSSLALWFFGDIGLTAAAGIKFAPALTSKWLYPRIIWGGIWGLLFLMPISSDRYLSRGLIFSIGPSLVDLFVIFPLILQKGQMGLALGTFTPALVLFYNAVWGVTASIWLGLTSR